MCFIRSSKGFQFHYAGLVANPPGDDLFRVFLVVRFYDSPAAVRAIVAAPFKMMQIACRVNLFYDCVAVACIVR